VEESNNCSFEFSSLFSPDGDGRETSPEDVFADVCGNEERDSTSKTVTLLKELVKKNSYDTSSNELKKDEDGVECA
jgi:hypothetical protein